MIQYRLHDSVSTAAAAATTQVTTGGCVVCKQKGRLHAGKSVQRCDARTCLPVSRLQMIGGRAAIKGTPADSERRLPSQTKTRLLPPQLEIHGFRKAKMP